MSGKNTTGVMKYVERITSKMKEAVEAAQAVYTAKAEEKQLELRIIQLQAQIAKDEALVEEQKSKEKISWDEVVEAIDNLALNTRKLSILEKLKEELF